MTIFELFHNTILSRSNLQKQEIGLQKSVNYFV